MSANERPKSDRTGNLKPAEIKPLVLAAKTAFDRLTEAGLIDGSETFDSWRHDQCMEAVGKPGLKACHHGDFQHLMEYFHTLAGNLGKAYEAAMKTGKPKDHAESGDTWENRRIIAHHIATTITRHTEAGGRIGVGYLVAIVRMKTRRPDLTLGRDWEAGLAERCTVRQLDQIRSTVINRISAADGIGEPATRNKSQRGRRRSEPDTTSFVDTGDGDPF